MRRTDRECAKHSSELCPSMSERRVLQFSEHPFLWQLQLLVRKTIVEFQITCGNPTTVQKKGLTSTVLN